MSLNSSKGFTLIELLTVLVVIGAVLSLVAPNFFHIYEEIKISAEEQKIHDVLENVQMKAFLRKVPYTLIFENNVMQIEGQDVGVVFDFIQFPHSSIVFNRNGFSNIGTLKYTIKGEARIFDIKS